jgi:hypothetical protein
LLSWARIRINLSCSIASMKSERAATRGPVGLSNWDIKKSTVVSKVVLAGRKPDFLCKNERGLNRLPGTKKGMFVHMIEGGLIRTSKQF